MPKQGRGSAGNGTLFVIAFSVSFAVILGVLLNWVKLEPMVYQLAGTSRSADKTPSVAEPKAKAISTDIRN